jgi:hypothetical protein
MSLKDIASGLEAAAAQLRVIDNEANAQKLDYELEIARLNKLLEPPEAPEMVWSFEDDHGGPWNYSYYGMRAVGSQDLPPDPKRFQIIASPTRPGAKALRCTTNGKDTGISGAGDRERADVKIEAAKVGAFEGARQCWAFSVTLGDNFVMPRKAWDNTMLVDFHHLGADSSGQAPLNFDIHNDGDTGKIKFRFIQYGGASKQANEFRQYLRKGEAPQIGVRYDYVVRTHWKSDATGQIEVWMRTQHEAIYTKQVERMAHPNLYKGYSMNVQLANYHPQWGVPSSIIHERIMWGKTPYSVAMADLEGVPR